MVALGLFALFCVISLGVELYVLTDIRDNKAKIRYDTRDKKLFNCSAFTDAMFIDTAIGRNHFLFFTGDESVFALGSDENLEYRRRMELAEFYAKNRLEYSKIATPVDTTFYKRLRGYCVSELSWASRILCLLLDIAQHTSLVIVCVMVYRLLIRRDMRLLRNSGDGAMSVGPRALANLDDADRKLLENPAQIIMKIVIFSTVSESGSLLIYPHPAARAFCNNAFHISGLLLVFVLRKRFYKHLFVDDFNSWHVTASRIVYSVAYLFWTCLDWFGMMAIDDRRWTFEKHTKVSPLIAIGIYGSVAAAFYVEKRNDKRLNILRSEGVNEQRPGPTTDSEVELPSHTTTNTLSQQKKTQQVRRMRLCLIWVAVGFSFSMAHLAYSSMLFLIEKPGHLAHFQSSGRLILWQLFMAVVCAGENKVWGAGLGNRHEPNFRVLILFPRMIVANTYSALLLFRAGLNSIDFFVSLVIMLSWESCRDTFLWHLVAKKRAAFSKTSRRAKKQGSEDWTRVVHSNEICAQGDTMKEHVVPEPEPPAWTSFRLNGGDTFGPEAWGSLPLEVRNCYRITWRNVQASFAEMYAGVITCVLVLFEFSLAKLAKGNFGEVSFLLTRDPDGNRHSVFAESELNAETYYRYTIPYGINNEGKPAVTRYSDEEFFWNFSGLLVFVMLEHVQISLCREWNLKHFAKKLAESRVFEESIKDDSKKVIRLEFFEKLARELFQVFVYSHFWLRLSMGVFIFLLFIKYMAPYSAKVVYV